MSKKVLSGKDIIRLGYPEGKVIAIALDVFQKHYKKKSKDVYLELLATILREPDAYRDDEYVGKIVFELEKNKSANSVIELNKEVNYFKIYGSADIDEQAKHQLYVAMKLPIAVAGALMPDAHSGYGLPIGGVLATHNAIIPYGVGVDIGCRMCMSIYPLSGHILNEKRSLFKKYLVDHTRFGNKEVFDDPMDASIFERDEFDEISILASLKLKAYRQVGTSGSGNHFVEFGVVSISSSDHDWDLPSGHYLALLSHSGSRGLGASIAAHYTQLAKKKCKLPKEAQHLAWLDMNSEEGQEYWLAMNLAGDYASECHHQIHRRITRALGEQPAIRIENHHNFAWKEKLSDGREVIVHRKGATPAGEGVLGIIPGSMTAPGFIVRGKGEALSISSASHGAGRLMSRTKAKQLVSSKEMKHYLEKHNVELIGGDVDESPMVYKDIHQVMAYQSDLVHVIGTFLPKIIRMDG
jgi:tRNA-splicing ligase RtcB